MRRKLLSVISIFTGVTAITLGLIVFQHYQPRNVAPSAKLELPNDPFLSSVSTKSESKLTESLFMFEDAEVKTAASNLPILPQPKPISSISWMEFDKVSILNQPTVMTILPGCGDVSFSSSQFQILPWAPDIFEKGEFDISKGTAVAWEHLGYTGLWIHSGFDWLGRPLDAQLLQNYLERKSNGSKRTPTEFDQNAAECLVGSQVNFQVGEDLLEGKVTAVLRIPAGEVETVSNHVMDLVSYVAMTYPESGFDKVEAPELILYFCGRLLNGEKPDHSIPDYSRTRILVAIDFDSQKLSVDSSN